MTCIVLMKTPSGRVLAVSDDENIVQWDSPDEAKRAAADQVLVKAWGGFLVDLDACEVEEI